MLHKILYLYLSAVFILHAGSTAYADQDIHIELKEIAYVNSGRIFLKDVARVRGNETFGSEIFENILLDDAPVYGKIKSLSRHQIEDKIKSHFRMLTEIRITGAAIVQIRIQGRAAKREEIVPVIREYLVRNTPWNEGEIVIGSITNLNKLELPPSPVILRISSRAPIIGNGTILVSIDAVREQTVLSSMWVTAEMHVQAIILKAAKRIPYRKIIAPDDIEQAVMKIDNPNANFYRNREDVLGKISKRNIPVGDPLTREGFDKPFLVSSGDIVQLRLQRKGLVLTSLVQAEEDGRLGQVIRVRHLEFSSLLKATVTGLAEVNLP